MNEVNKILTLAQRDLLKLVRDRTRIFASLIFPVIFLGFFGVVMNAGLSQFNLKVNFVDYVFSGILLQTIFQSSMSGIISLVEDREKDFAMSIFVSPVSRYSIVIGKLLGEGLVSFAQVIGIIIFGKLFGATFTLTQLLATLPFLLLAALVGGSFGVLLASRIGNSSSAQRIFPFLIFPMIFSSGAFTLVNNLPPFIKFITYINPIFYGVDLIRNILFANSDAKSIIVANSFSLDLIVFTLLGLIFFFLGTYLFTQKEGNK